MPAWEYKRVRSTWSGKAKAWMAGETPEQELLNQLGKQGWEMTHFQDCAVQNLFGTITEEWHSFMFRRPLVE